MRQPIGPTYDGNEAPTPNDSKEMPKEPAGLFGVQGEVGDGKALHEAIRQKNATPAKAFLRKVASIFMPLIPGFVGCGFLTGLLGIVKFYDPALLALAPLRILLLADFMVYPSGIFISCCTCDHTWLKAEIALVPRRGSHCAIITICRL